MILLQYVFLFRNGKLKHEGKTMAEKFENVSQIMVLIYIFFIIFKFQLYFLMLSLLSIYCKICFVKWKWFTIFAISCGVKILKYRNLFYLCTRYYTDKALNMTLEGNLQWNHVIGDFMKIFLFNIFVIVKIILNYEKTV
jgi:hypothetical protein